MDLYAQILEGQTGPGQVSKGIFTLPMRKVTPAPWPRLLKNEPTPARKDSNDDGLSGMCWCGLGEVG